VPDIEHAYQGLQESFENFQNQIDSTELFINQLINQQEKYWLQYSYQIYKSLSERHHDDIMNMLRPIYHPESELRTKIKTQADWRFPAMIIRSGVEDFIDSMVSFDPLYVVDTDVHMINKAMGKFNDQYQSRLRNIVIEENVNKQILEKIPNHQIGLCFVYNFFNHRPIDLIEKYLTEIYDKLRPGGKLIMSFNDCDREPGVALVEQELACYTPGGVILHMVKNIGYVKSYSWHNGLANTYLEVTKPGQLTSLRGGQSLAKIIKIPKSPEELELQKLLDEAVQFGFVEDKNKKPAALDLQKFIRDEKIKKRQADAAEKERQQRKEWLALSPEEKQAKLTAAMSQSNQK
jgi:SAM-dependent methyltransferase